MRPTPPSLKGHLLLDGGKLGGSAFFRSVVLICQHDPKGAFGLVLTQPSDRRLEDILPVELPPHLGGLTVSHGGPVQPNAFSFLHFHPQKVSGNVLEHLSLGHEPESLELVASGWTKDQRLFAFAGYAGWSPGQLDDEMRRDSWLHQPATPEMFVDLDPSLLWRSLLLKRHDWQCRLLAESPEDLSWN
jgi:putative transcriptional regulator